MKHFKPIIIYLSIFIFLTVSVLGIYPKKVYAEVPNEYKAIGLSGTYTSLDYPYTFHSKHWIIQNPTGIPTAQIGSPYFFYTPNEQQFIVISAKNLIQAVLTAGISVVMEPNSALATVQAFLASIDQSTYTDPNNATWIQGGVYDGQHNLLGYALNDISGCYYENLNVDNITVPGETVNNVYNFYKYQTEDSTNYADYITVIAPPKSYVMDNYLDTTNREPDKTDMRTNLNLILDNTQLKAGFRYSSDYQSLDGITFYGSEVIVLDDYIYILDTTNNNYWNNLCDKFDLKDGKNEITYQEVLNNYLGYPDNAYIRFRPYTDQNTEVTSFPRIYLGNNTASTNVTTELYLGLYGNFNGRKMWCYNMDQSYTIYKDWNTYNSIQNNTYRPTVFYGTKYLNYDLTLTNNFTVSVQNIDNSTTINGDIYDDCTQSYYDNTDNSNTIIDNSEDNDTIISIYYPEPNPDPDPYPDPDPDPDPNDPDTILDAILAALKRFFEIIGKLLGTVLAGLLEVIDTLLESIAGIMENLTGVTDFISALFSWIPSPVPEIIGVGISICILAAIIKFIRG